MVLEGALCYVVVEEINVTQAASQKPFPDAAPVPALNGGQGSGAR